MNTPLITNAWLDPGLTLRVGVPHFNGALPAHCSEEDTPIMVSAGAYWRPKKQAFAEPTAFGWTTDHCNVALDSAGFVAMKRWGEQGAQPGIGGVYPWSLNDYLSLVIDVMPRWWSQPDACVEPGVAPDEAAVRHRCLLTTRMLEDTLILSAAIAAQVPGLPLRPPVPVLQGWRPEQYRESLMRALDAWDRLTDGTNFERQPTLIGIGSVCRRELHHPQHGLWRVLDAVGKDLPKGISLHLFGVKGEAIADMHHYPMVASVDSMAYDFGARVEARTKRISNTMAHRIGHMDRWQERQLKRMAIPGQGQCELFAIR